MIIKQKDETARVVKQIADFQSGKLKPLVTSVDYIDYHGMGGLYPGTVVLIGGLSGSGKTYELERIIRGIAKNQPEEDYIVVSCTWEIEAFKTITRAISKHTGKTAKEILLSPPTEEDIKSYTEVLQQFRTDNTYLQPEPVNVEEFIKDMTTIINKHKDKPILITIDNLENILVGSEGQKTALDNLTRAVNSLKKLGSFVSFILLNQLNANIETRENPQNHVPIASDLYGSNAGFKLADIVAVKHLPYKLGIEEYSIFPKGRYKYIDPYFIKEGKGKLNKFKGMGNGFIHILKSRNTIEEYDSIDVYPIKIFDVPQEEDKKEFEEFDY